jgi:hypothetical protein
MFIDSRAQFADAVRVGASTGTANVGDVVTISGRNLGAGVPLFLNIVVDVAGAGAGTTQFVLVSDAVSTPDTSTATKHLFTKVFTTTDLTVGTVLSYALPDTDDYETYLGLQAVQASATESALKVTAYLSPDSVPSRHSYADAQN